MNLLELPMGDDNKKDLSVLGMDEKGIYGLAYCIEYMYVISVYGSADLCLSCR